MKTTQKTLNNYAEFVGQVCPTYKAKLVKRLAFTLAEVLITITIIGVVAAMTIPNLVADYEARQYKIQSSNFQRKLGEALRVMSAQNNLRGFSSTKEFVTELSKNFKITKICDTVTDCFVDNIIKQDGNLIDVSTLTTSASLGHANFNSETVGVQFGNGITGIIAYNKTFKKNNDSDIVTFTETTDKKLKLVSMDTDVLSLVYDVSGYDKPNTNGEDILGINTSISSDGVCKHTQFKDYCVEDLGKNYASEDCTTSSLSDCNSNYKADYWVGAKQACNALNMTLPTISQLEKMYHAGIKDELGLTGLYRSSSEIHATYAYYFNFSSGITESGQGEKNKQYGVICIEN